MFCGSYDGLSRIPELLGEGFLSGALPPNLTVFLVFKAGRECFLVFFTGVLDWSVKLLSL